MPWKGVEISDVRGVEDAENLLDGVWSFVIETCNGEDVEPPSKRAALEELKSIIAYRQVD